MNFTYGIPPESRSLVVIPAMLGSKAEIEELVENLEVHFLANRDENLHFALLTDYKDASQETLPEDELLLELTKQKIADLNKKYESRHQSIFFLFHRPVNGTPCERLWMGYERKRGKLTELNALLRGEGQNYFSHIEGKQGFFSNIKYVITVDADTQLPRDSARKMIAAMAIR
jgi:hypothetical protein